MTNRTITKDQWNNLKAETSNSVLSILDTVDVLIDYTRKSPHPYSSVKLMCTGLYTHAVEEYGKLLYLESLHPVNDLVDIDYDAKFKNHRLKFELALKKLPSNCKILRIGAFDSNVFQSDAFDTGTFADWETRLGIFNTNFDNSGNVVPYPIIDLDKLYEATIEFRKEMNRAISL
ncbi:MAG: hypothetical protein KGH85_07775 [Thaumarchaeota archaeon]|nr:hypothetical protein [Nitrososphaerota archaeon]